MYGVSTVAEEILDPELEIVDPHHHLWQHANHRYLLDELLADTGSGHNITHTVYIDCRSMYRAAGPVEMKPVGETEFANGVAAMSASGIYGPTLACAGIVSYVDLALGARARPVLEAHVEAGRGRFRGVRATAAYDADPVIGNTTASPGAITGCAPTTPGPRTSRTTPAPSVMLQ